MSALRSKHLAAASAVLMLPALVLVTCGVLYNAFDLEALNDRLGAFCQTPLEEVFLSPILVLGGVAASLALNLWAACRMHVGLDTGTVYVTFWIARTVRHLIFLGVALLLLATLLTYGFVENFRIVPR
jgi:fumarate reductase subunit D